MPDSELRCPRHVCLFYPPVWIRAVILTESNTQGGKYLKQTHLFTKSESVFHWVWLTWARKPDLTSAFYSGQAQQIAAASGEAFSLNGWVRLSLVKDGVMWLSMARPGWHYDTLPGEAGFVAAVGHAIIALLKVLPGFSVTQTDPHAISWWFLTQQGSWLMPAPHLSGSRWYPWPWPVCCGVQQGHCSSRQRNSIVSVAWVNSLLVYSQLTLQVRISFKKIVKFSIFFIYTTGMPLTACLSSTFNKQQWGGRCCEGFILLLHWPTHPCCSLQSTQVTLAAWSCCSYSFKVTGLHLYGSH